MADEAQFIADFNTSDYAQFVADFSSVEYQIARPDSDVTDGAWLNEAHSTTNLYASIDETSYSDTDFIYTRSLSTCEIGLGDVDDPSTGDDHFVHYRAIGDGTTDLVVKLMQGSTTIATWTESNVSGTMTTYSHTLTAGEANNITDYTDLRLKFEAA